MAIREILTFEFKYHLKRPQTYIYFVLFFGLAVFIYGAMGGLFGKIYTAPPNTSGKVFLNSPFVITSFLASATTVGLIIVPAIMGNAIYRDFKYNTSPLFGTRPLSSAGYLYGRFAGAFLVTLIVFLGVFLGVAVTCALPGMDPDRIGPVRLMAYLQPLLIIVIPNLFFTGSFFFAAATLTRKMLMSYVGGVLLFVAYSFVESAVLSLENTTYAGLFNPFGSTSLAQITQYWTVVEQNEMIIPVTAPLIANRLLWIAIGAGLLILTHKRSKALKHR